MSTTSRTVTAHDAEGAVPRMTLQIPETWTEVSDAGPVLGAWSDDRSLSPGIATNVVLTALELPEDVDLLEWQRGTRAIQLSSLPDLQVLDDRQLDDGHGTEQWYASSVMTDQHGVTVLTRRWSRRAPGFGLTLTVTTLPLVDAEHSDVLDAIAESWTVEADSENGAPDDHA